MVESATAWIEKLKIHELCARYTLTLDGHDIEGWAACFTKDGVFGYGDRALVGRDKIFAYGEVHKDLASRHINTSLVCDIDSTGERATGRSAIVLTLATRRGYKVAFMGHYRDELQRVDGQWLISRRWVVADALPGDPSFDLPASDPDLVPLVQPLWDAYQRLGDVV